MKVVQRFGGVYHSFIHSPYPCRSRPLSVSLIIPTWLTSVGIYLGTIAYAYTGYTRYVNIFFQLKLPSTIQVSQGLIDPLTYKLYLDDAEKLGTCNLLNIEKAGLRSNAIITPTLIIILKLPPHPPPSSNGKNNVTSNEFLTWRRRHYHRHRRCRRRSQP